MCPSCAGRRVRTRTKGCDADGRPLRDYTCLDCKVRFSTVEVVTPVRLFVLDAQRKTRNRLAMRKRRGYHGGLGGAPLRAEPRLIVEVRLARG